MNTSRSLGDEMLSKVPAVTLTFWIIKILATTLGETGGDTVTMTWLGETTSHANPFGYLIGTAIFGVLLVVLVLLQIAARKFTPWLYWATIVASTTAGTTTSTTTAAAGGGNWSANPSMIRAPDRPPITCPSTLPWTWEWYQ